MQSNRVSNSVLKDDSCLIQVTYKDADKHLGTGWRPHLSLGYIQEGVMEFAESISALRPYTGLL